MPIFLMQNILNTYKVSQEKQYTLYKLDMSEIRILSNSFDKKQNLKNPFLDNHCSVSDYESAEYFKKLSTSQCSMHYKAFPWSKIEFGGHLS